MNLGVKLAALAGVGAVLCAAIAGPLSPEPAQAFGNPRITVNVAGPQAGTVEFDNVESLLPELLFNPDNGELVMPTNYCGLRITHVGALYWEDSYGNLVEAENHGEVTYVSGEGYMLMGEDVTNAYLGGMEFTGALDTCDDNEAWYFPTPLSYGGNGPQYGAARLILELDSPPSNEPTIEFLDHAMEPVELPDLYEDWEPPADLEEWCEQIPEFCDPEGGEDPDTPAADVGLSVGCIYYDPSECPDYPQEPAPGFTLGCMAYSIGCDPEPQPIDTLVGVSGDEEKLRSDLYFSPSTELMAPTTR